MAQMKSTSQSAKSNGQSNKANGRSNRGAAVGNTQLEKFFEDALKDIYWAEKHLVKALGKMQKAATTEELKSAIQEHQSQTEEHVNRLDQVFEILGKRPQAKKCEAMEGLIKEGDEVVEETEEGSMTRDVGIIVSAQKVEHYEISAYGSLKTIAQTLGLNEAAGIFAKTLEEEKQTDENLTSIAENKINWEAEKETSDEE